MNFLLNHIWKIIWITLGILLLVAIFKNYQKIVKFLMETKQELTKVSWSTRHELIGSTAAVITVIIITAIYIGIIDLTLSKGLSLMFK